jgi:hypothetical protein
MFTVSAAKACPAINIAIKIVMATRPFDCKDSIFLLLSFFLDEMVVLTASLKSGP